MNGSPDVKPTRESSEAWLHAPIMPRSLAGEEQDAAGGFKKFRMLRGWFEALAKASPPNAIAGQSAMGD